MNRWPLEEGTIISRKEEWTGTGHCDFCKTDDHSFSVEILEMTQSSIRGKITMYGCAYGERSSTFTARGYWDENSTYYEAGSKTDFKDSGSVASYAKDAIDYFIDHGVVLGSNGKINPKSNITRAEMAVILHRVLTY